MNDRAALVKVLSSMSSAGRRGAAVRFLEGLSSDELRYIASYFGARLMDPDLAPGPDRDSAARRVSDYQLRAKPVASTGDVSHKMILLLEYLNVAELRRVAATA